MKFAPKRDAWLSLVMYFCIIALALAGASPWIIGGTGIIGGTLLSLFCLAIAGVTSWLWFGIDYALRDSELVIRTGFLTKVIPLDKIVSIKPIRSWQSGAAASGRSLEIRSNQYEAIHISPLDEQAFLKEFRLRCKHASIEERM
ncbi:hypothetical protein FE784_27380 [Paenibacillus hemerocallicola]|uniref:Uncharacterized protein YyaB-like PH domain-containing protein n=1 Tax=Paenibacillus hemerocallicola TaxID=1172614 RepID=A0A5C4T4P0_9BACL|nr:PH domain-containing protein [Paenibacillus hemerocallicola]TNJ63129.1 hypothetical protein FE784_27380 [Paenibacillus hemerocallicola]